MQGSYLAHFYQNKLFLHKWFDNFWDINLNPTPHHIRTAYVVMMKTSVFQSSSEPVELL